MTFVTKSAPIAALMAIMILAPAGAQAQEPRFRVAFTPAIATVSGDAELALGGSFGYRFSEHFWFEGDLTWIDAAPGGSWDLSVPLPERGPDGFGRLDGLMTRASRMFGGGLGFGPGFPTVPIGGLGLMRATADGSTLAGTMGIRYEFPVQTERFRPYVAGGLGINHTQEEFELEETMFTPRITDSASHTGYAFSAGAGASIRLVSQLWADVDARYFRLSRDRDIMRLGGGVSVRF